jgi:xanthine dehydrogenase YagT iron-sulfur-binding subunit
MGAAKQLIKIEGDSMIRRATKVAIDSGVRPVVVVLGANANLIKAELNGLDFILTINSEWQAGMATSIRAGLNAMLKATPQLAGVIMMPADQPKVGADSLNKILAAQSEEKAKLVAARFNGVLGAPAFFSRDHFEELLHLDGSGGAKTLLERYKKLVLPVDIPEAEYDLDTPEDVVTFRSKYPAYVESTATASQVHSRRQFIANVAIAGVGIAAAPSLLQSIYAAEPVIEKAPALPAQTVLVKLRVNGTERALQLDPRVTLLDALRERLGLIGSKKGCDHGQCGACTILVNGQRINSCLALAVVHDGDEITTIEGLAKGEQLHPVQAAFLEKDGFQCGYCTPGQICSAVALIKEGHAGDDAEIREWMSGNICRCGAYTNIVAAIREANSKTAGSL